MSRRIRASQLESGSDSFLDIIANIVGILIILIVMAGVRVSQLPAEQPADSQQQPDELQFASLDVTLGPAAPEPEDDPAIPEPTPVAPPDPPQPAKPSPNCSRKRLSCKQNSRSSRGKSPAPRGCCLP